MCTVRLRSYQLTLTLRALQSIQPRRDLVWLLLFWRLCDVVSSSRKPCNACSCGVEEFLAEARLSDLAAVEAVISDCTLPYVWHKRGVVASESLFVKWGIINAVAVDSEEIRVDAFGLGERSSRKFPMKMDSSGWFFAQWSDSMLQRPLRHGLGREAAGYLWSCWLIGLFSAAKRIGVVPGCQSKPKGFQMREKANTGIIDALARIYGEVTRLTTQAPQKI